MSSDREFMSKIRDNGSDMNCEGRFGVLTKKEMLSAGLYSTKGNGERLVNPPLEILPADFRKEDGTMIDNAENRTDTKAASANIR